MNWHRCE